MFLCTLAALFAVTWGAHQHPTTTTPIPKTDHELIQDLLAENAALRGRLGTMEQGVGDLSRQVMLQQLFVEERIRSDGSSGLKQVRNQQSGERSYLTADYATMGSVAGIHEHINNIRTVGMGELNVVLNGVEFRTRHNDYRLYMPTTDRTYNGRREIPFPDVPPAVLAKLTVAEQVEEMKEWFKAFKMQDHSVRDYRKYFKPVLCYMEGGWTTNTKTLEEPFFSDRHHIDASSWFDLQDKVRFASYSGGKSSLENFAYLPTTIINVVNGTPEYAQWNYRIMCHPLKNDLPTSAFEMIDDVGERMKKGMPMSRYNETRLARFQLRRQIPTNRNSYIPRTYLWGLLDDLMYEIPGKDNYGANITDDSLGLTMYHVNSNTEPLEPVNTAYYNRMYKIVEKDAMGNKNVHRGFSDSNFFAAQTSNPRIAALSVDTCKDYRDHKTHHNVHNCTHYSQRYTWAIPLEIIYLTPLYEWNPHNFRHTTASGGPEIYSTTHNSQGQVRNGKLDADHAYNGTWDKGFYRTPIELFSTTKAVGADRADTAKASVGVLDPHGVVQKVAASGTHIILPNIEGVGKVRTRYPIMPVHADGEQSRKELDALKEMVMNMAKYSSLFEVEPTTVSNANTQYNQQPHMLKVTPTTQDPPGYHGHDLMITQADIEDMKKGQTVRGILTTTDQQHQHSIDIHMDAHGQYVMAACDGLPRCWDGHDTHLTLDF
ncbi:uncharacterized protein LOC128246493 [Mya arenaria]|uniref:uncharacterized protein LOC128246493 n=1 Tax=Mya arenaria TaxID=6604 RepID=UPI0022E86749|nr:uncharacterized protein LOC128246493 [Mya arenaria]